MRREWLCATIVMVIPLCLAQTASAGRTGQLHRDIQQLAGELLAGQVLIVRIYPNPADDPRSFKKVRVLLAELGFEHSAVKAVDPALSEGACIAVLGADQTDETVTTVLGRWVSATLYRPDGQVNLMPASEEPDCYPFWTFFDAEGEPIANATVEIGYATDQGTVIWLESAKLDERGQLARLSPSGAFTFRVEHSDYGRAVVSNRGHKHEPSGIYVVPLIRRDSPTVASSVQGTVRDTEGRPVCDAEIWCPQIVDANNTRHDMYGRYRYYALTDAEGEFSLCLPFLTDDLVIEGLPAPGSRYEIQIKPPKYRNLRQYGQQGKARIVAGTCQTFTLTPLEPGKAFHTFSFEYLEGPVTDPEELSKLKVFVYRDGPWATLTYGQIEQGYVLPTGMLRASIWRWGRDFAFEPIELTPDSPEHLVFRAGEPIHYQGQVLDAATELPVAGAIVSVGGVGANGDPCSVTAEQWQRLQDWVTRTDADDSSQALYHVRRRAVVTDADGFFALTFLPGYQPNINAFAVDKPGYLRRSVPALDNDKDRIVAMDTIRLERPDSLAYFPRFVFLDESGATIDPNDLQAPYVTVQNSAGRSRTGPMESILAKRPFTPGIYRFEAVCRRKHYVFAPADLTDARPPTVVIQPEQTQPAEIIYQGQVLHGVTGRPIPQAIVLYRLLGTKGDASSLEPGHWTTIRALGPHPSPTDPALAPLIAKLDTRAKTLQCALTDDEGWFQLPVQPTPARPPSVLLVLAENFLGAEQQLVSLSHPGAHQQIWQPDENGIITLDTLKLFPAGTLIVHPVVPDFGGSARKTRLRLRWRISEDPPPGWVEDICTAPIRNNGASTFFQVELQPNLDQTLYVPAGVDLQLHLYQLLGSPPPPVRLGTVRLQPGETVKLGRVAFDEGIEIRVRVVNAQNEPLATMPILCIDEDEMSRHLRSDANGRATIDVLPHSSGRFCTVYIDYETQERFEECVPFTVGGEEDAGREFTLTLSDEMIERFAQLRR